MNRLTVSTIIPAYRAASTIRRAVDSALAQSYPASEIIVVDDGTPEPLSSALGGYGDRVRLLRQPNSGAAAARNTAIESAKGDLLAFLDADDYWEPHKLATHVRCYRQHPRLGLSCSRFYEQTPGQARIVMRQQPQFPMDAILHLGGSDAFRFATRAWTGTVVVPRRLLVTQRFESGFEPAEDRHLWARLLTTGPVVYHSPYLATAVLTPGSLSRSDIDRDCVNMLRLVHAHRHVFQPRELRDWEARIHRRWAGEHLGAGNALGAIRPALRRLARQRHSPEAWWIVLKSLGLCCKQKWGGRCSADPGEQVS